MQLWKGGKVPQVCAKCGIIPADHWFVWSVSTVDIFVSKLGASKRASVFWSTLVRKSAELTAPMWPFVAKVAEALRLISYNDDIERVLTRRSRVVWEEARRRGVPMRQLFLLGTPTEFFEAEIHGSLCLFDSLPIPPSYRTGALWADDKYLFKQKFTEEGIPVPVSYSVSTLRDAKLALARLGVVCVKPRAGSNGRHTFPHVTTKKELTEAFHSVKEVCRWVVVEQHLEGNISRATCVNGRLVGFLESQYPIVTGNGRSTIRELIEKENTDKPTRVEDITITPVHEYYIARRGYGLDSVLEAGKKLPLIYWAGYGSGGRNWEHGTDIHPKLQSEIERAARATGLPVVGFDLIIKDTSISPQGQQWGFIEANSLPWIDLHSFPLYGTPRNVAAYVWDLWALPIMQKVPVTAGTF